MELSGIIWPPISPLRYQYSQYRGNHNQQACYDCLLGRSSVDGYGAHYHSRHQVSLHYRLQARMLSYELV